MTLRACLLALGALLGSAAPAAQSAEPGDAVEAVFGHPARARALLATTLAAPAKTLASAQTLRGTFAHQRYLSETPQPLTATGEFVFARGLGVHWRTLKPFDSTFILTAQGVVQRDEGVETLRASADEQPAVRMLADVFLALFTLDVRSLEASFDLYAMSQGERWLLGLAPKSSAAASVFQRAALSGAANVEQIVLIDRLGERTVVELRELSISTEPPDAAVRALFAP